MTTAMGTAAACWVREHAWTSSMRATHASLPEYYSTCACQNGTTDWCLRDKCTRCHRATPQPSAETYITNRRQEVLHFSEPYEHASTLESLTLRRCTIAVVWLADRTCRWICPCQCHRPGGLPRRPTLNRRRRRAARSAAQQDDVLFDLDTEQALQS